MADAPHSRLPINPSTQLPSIQSFGELSQFLRSALADEESHQLADGMGGLAISIEAVLSRLDQHGQAAGPAPLAAPLMDLMTVLREHRVLVIALSPVWRGLYEYASYLAALNNFRVLIGQWLLAANQPTGTAALDPQGVSFSDFELVAWRTLGEGMLLIDMYEQLRAQDARGPGPAPEVAGALDATRLERARSWWARLGK